MILAIRTDSPTAEIYLYQDKQLIEKYTWEAGRQLSAQLLVEIKALLERNRLEWPSLAGVVVFRGPGSFTGLRIGATVANAIAYAQSVAVVGSVGEAWAEDGLNALSASHDDGQVTPEYGAEANITKPRA